MDNSLTRTWFDPLFRTEGMRAIFSDARRLQGMLDFEAALAQAQAGAGLIPAAAANAIAAQCRAERFNLAALSQASQLSGNSAIPVVKELTRLVEAADKDASQYVHLGATSQDAMDTGLVLQMRDAFKLLNADIGRLCESLAALARKHRETPMAGRTWLQHAAPVTFGLKVAGWLDSLARQGEQLRMVRTQVLVLQLGGAVGTRAAMGENAEKTASLLAQALGLMPPALPWHSQRDRLVHTAAALGVLTGVLAKIATDISLMCQSEVAELAEPAAPGRGGSSSMPQKQNPVSCAAILANATRMPGLVATMLAAMPQEHERGLGNWHAEWEVLPEIFELTAGALAHANHVIAGLHVDTARMRANLELTRGQIYAESLSSALASAIGRLAAHAAVQRASRRALESGQHLHAVMEADPDISRHLPPDRLQALFDPQPHARAAGLLVDRALEALAPHTIASAGGQHATR